MKRKTMLLVAILTLTMIMVSMLAACYVSNPAKLSKIAGTYQLSSFTRIYDSEKNAETGETVSHDIIAEQGVVAYLVVNTDGTGYYVYKDNTHAVSTRAVKITYNYDDESPSLVNNIVYTYGETTSGDGAPGRGHETLGVNFKRRTKNLSYTMPAIFGRKTSQSVTYKQVSTDTTLGYVQKQLGVTLRYAPYEVAGLDGWHNYTAAYDDGYPYVYYYIDLHMDTRTADIYYALKEDKAARTLSAQPITYSGPDNEGVVTLTIAGTAYVSVNGGYGTVPTAIKRTADNPADELWFGKNVRTGFDIDVAIAEDMRIYNEYLESLQAAN